MADDENDEPHNRPTASARPPRKLPASFASGPPKPKVRKLPRFGGEDSATHAMPELVLQQPAISSWHAEEVDLHCDGLLRRHAEGTIGPLGFDVEWPVTFRQGQAPLPIATVQLAADGDVFVFQVSPARGGLPPRLRALLEEPTLPKAGVGISNDALKLRRDYGLCCAGLLDLSQLAACALADGARPWFLAELWLG